MWSWCATRWSGRNQSWPDTSPWVDDLISHSRASYFISPPIRAMQQSCCGNTKTEFSQNKSQSVGGRASECFCLRTCFVSRSSASFSNNHSLPFSLLSFVFLKISTDSAVVLLWRPWPLLPSSCCVACFDRPARRSQRSRGPSTSFPLKVLTSWLFSPPRRLRLSHASLQSRHVWGVRVELWLVGGSKCVPLRSDT